MIYRRSYILGLARARKHRAAEIKKLQHELEVVHRELKSVRETRDELREALRDLREAVSARQLVEARLQKWREGNSRITIH